MVIKAVFCVTEIIIVQLMLKHVWKKDDFLYKTDTYFARWSVIQGMEARYKDMVSIHEFIERKTMACSIFVTASEHMWICLTFGDDGY